MNRKEIQSRPCKELFPDEMYLVCYAQLQWKMTLERLCVALLWFSKVTYTRTGNGRAFYCSHVLCSVNPSFSESKDRRYASFEESTEGRSPKGTAAPVGRCHLIEDFLVGGVETHNGRVLFANGWNIGLE